jgi:hypothetical protein
MGLVSDHAVVMNIPAHTQERKSMKEYFLILRMGEVFTGSTFSRCHLDSALFWPAADPYMGKLIMKYIFDYVNLRKLDEALGWGFRYQPCNVCYNIVY